MKREDVKKVFESATDEQVNALLDIHSKDIGAAKSDLETLKVDLKTAKDTIKTLEGSVGDTVELKKQLETYKTTEAERVANEKKAQERAGIEARFDGVVGDRKFLHDFVRKGVLDEFEKALSNETNNGKGDKDVFEALTLDKEYFSSSNPESANLGGFGGGKSGSLDDAAMRQAMGLPAIAATPTK